MANISSTSYNQPPGKLYDLGCWKLQLPVATKKSVKEIFPKELAEGYTSEYFYTENDGSIAFWTPSNGATTPNSQNPRTELREMNINGDWEFCGSHILSAECAVIELPSNQKGMIIGQIHGNNADLDPQLFKLYYGIDGSLVARFKNDKNPSSKDDLKLKIGKFKLGERIKYTISVVDSTITVVVSKDNEIITKSATLKNPVWQKQQYYFKVGNYFQVNHRIPDNSSLVCFYSIKVEHS